MTTDERKQIATTILQQLGGGRFLAMTGAKNLIFGEAGELSFRLPIGRWNHVKIELTPMDVYSVTFSKLGRRSGVPTVTATQTCNDVYCDDLQYIVSKCTGLALTL